MPRSAPFLTSLVLPFAIAAPALLSPAHAGDLNIQLTDESGRPVADAVVTVKPAAGLPKRPITFPWAPTMVQQNIVFNPHVLIVPVGATVHFPNKDKVRHHIYSFSKPAKFEIKLFGSDQSRSYVFKSAGAVALGCNIHDQMNGFIKVVDTPYAGKSDGTGRVRIAGLPNGAAQVTIWHPSLRAKDNEIVASVPIGAGAVSRSFALTVRAGR
jgi:hypothetical protein